MEFEWDEAKAASNLRKHGVSFRDGLRVFGDPLRRGAIERVADGEVRWQTFGLPGREPLLMVAHTLEDRGEGEVIRIISVRPATGSERKRYERQHD